MKRFITVGCLVMALIAALAYVLMGVGILEPGDLMETDEVMPAFYFIIPVAYVAMGVVVFLNKRWLLIIDAIITGFTILVFYATYADQPDVLWSAPGLITKIAQVFLLAGLIYLIVKFKSGTARLPETPEV